MEDNDAVNVAQLDEGVEESKSYTDNRVTYAIDTANDYTDAVAKTTLNDSKVSLSGFTAAFGRLRELAAN